MLLGEDAGAPRVHALFYADDIAIFAANEADGRRALDALQAWASRWRFTFNVGVEKSAVMRFGAARISG